MTNIHSNNSHKTLESSHHVIPQVPESQEDLPKSPTPLEPPKALAPDQEEKALIVVDNAHLQETAQPIEPASTIVIPPSVDQKRRFTPKQIMLAAVMTAALLGSAIGAIYFRSAQYNKIADAERLLSETCHTTTLSDADALNSADSGWNNAMARLQGVPPIPGFGAAEVQALQTKYAWCHINIEGTKLFQEAATMSEPARSAVQQSLVLSEEEWAKHLTHLDAAIEHLNVISNSFGNSELLKDLLPIFNATQQRLKEYQQIRADAQTRRDREHNAVLNFTAAKELYQQFEANQNTVDDNKRESAEIMLRNALDRLRKVPLEGTTVSMEASQLRQTYAQALNAFKAEPAKRQLRQLAASFDRLSSDLEARISVEELGASLDNIEAQLSRLQQASVTRGHSALRYFQSALEDYRLAQNLLTICAQPNTCFTGAWGDSDLYLRDTSPLFRTLADSYQVESVLTLQGRGIRLRSATDKTAISTVLGAADSKVKAAEQLIN